MASASFCQIVGSACCPPRAGQDNGGEAQADQLSRARVVDAEIDDENAVHTPFTAPTTVQF